MRAVISCGLALVLLTSAGCHRTKVVSLDQSVASDRVWVTLNNESVVLLSGPQIYGNKLVGFVDGKYEEYPTTHVKQLHVREPHTAATVALVATGAAAFAAFTYIIAGSSDTPADPNYCDLPEHVDELPCQE